jgi:hypothetical protein
MASFPTSYLPDDEEEQRLAEIERITGGFGTELAAGMGAGGIDIGAGDPEPVDPRAGLPTPVPYGQQTPRPSQPTQPEPRTPMNPGEPAWARGLTPATSSAQLASSGTDPLRAAGGVVQRTADESERRGFNQDIVEMKGREAAAGGTPGERRGRIALGAILGGMGRSSDQIGAALGPSPADRQAAIREQMAQMVAQRNEQQQTRQRTIAEQAIARQRQANEDRRFGADQARFDYQRERDAASRTQDDAQFQQGQAQDMKERVLGIEGADQRSRRHANAMVGRDPNSGGIVRPGTVPTGPAAPEMGQMLDAPIIQALIDNRPEIMQGARAEAERRRATGQEADVGAIAWEMGSGMFGRLPRDEQDRIRRAYISPESTNTAVTAPVREEQALATRVRQYGSEARDRIEWERSVGAASQVLGGVSDAELRAAQQWIQGGAARQSIAAGLAPRAEQIGETISTLQNIMLRERSGAAVTDQEFQRLRGELGSNWWSSPDSLRRAVARMRATNEAIQEGLGAEYGLEVVEAYEANRQAVRGRRGGAPASGGGGRYRAGQTITGPNGATRTLTQEQADRLNARGQ